MLFTLMNKDDRVFDFVFDEDRNAVLEVCRIFDLHRAPIAIWNECVFRFATHETLATLTDHWWKRRGIPASRVGWKWTRRQIGFEISQLTAATCAFSLTDQYWARPTGRDLTWETGNFFLNDFDDGIGLVLAGMSGAPDSSSPSSPSSTADGNLPKMWHVAPDGTRELFKAGSGVIRQEPFNEVVATRLYERLLQQDQFVPYRLERRGESHYSVCPCFIDAEHEFVTARDLFWADPSSHATPSFATLARAAENQGASDLIAQLSQIFTLDYILGNVDRHLSNFGIIRRQSDRSFERCAPIFDTGLCLLCHGQDGDVDAIDVPANPLLGRQSQQLALVQDLTWFDEGRLQDFDEEVMEILRQCPSRYMDRERIAFIGAFVSSGIQVVAELKATDPVDPDDIAVIDQRAQLIDAMRARLMREAGTGTRLHV